MTKKIPDVGGTLNTPVVDTKVKDVSNKILDPCILVNKTDCDAKILEIEGKYFTASDCNNYSLHLIFLMS